MATQATQALIFAIRAIVAACYPDDTVTVAQLQGCAAVLPADAVDPGNPTICATVILSGADWRIVEIDPTTLAALSGWVLDGGAPMLEWTAD